MPSRSTSSASWFQIGTVDAGIDQDQPTLPAHHDGIAPDPLALPDPDAVGHLIQHPFTLSGVRVRRELRRPSGPDSEPAGPRRHALTWHLDRASSDAGRDVNGTSSRNPRAHAEMSV